MWETPEKPYLSALFVAQDLNNIVLVILAYLNYLMGVQTSILVCYGVDNLVVINVTSFAVFFRCIFNSCDFPWLTNSYKTIFWSLNFAFVAIIFQDVDVFSAGLVILMWVKISFLKQRILPCAHTLWKQIFMKGPLIQKILQAWTHLTLTFTEEIETIYND